MKRRLLKLFGAAAALTIISFLISAANLGSVNAQTQKKPASPANAADVKIRQKMTYGGRDTEMETVIYVKGSRMRNEMLGGNMAMTTITQCDLKRTLAINDKTKTYIITPQETNAAGNSGAGGAVSVAPNAQPSQVRRGGVVTVTNTVTDTGERKQIFGFTARRIKTSIVTESSPDACSKGNSKMETDGWYIDFQYDFDCPEQKKIVAAPPPVPIRPDCEDEIRTKTIGTAKLGFPVLTTITMYDSVGTATTVTNEVLELSRAPLDAALFDVPAGYALAKNPQELYGMSNAASDGGSGRTNGGATSGVSAATTSPAAATAGFTAAGAPKKEGVRRIGVVMPKAQMTSGDAAQAAEAVRNTFAAYLKSPNVELVALDARLPSQALEEAKQSRCDYVLYASLTQKKGGGGMFGKALGNIAGAALGNVPVNTAGEAAARSATITGVYTAASISGSIKAKDELTLEYKLEATDGSPGAASTAKAKAKSDGEDVLTPLVEKAAQAIMDAITKR